MVTMNGDKFIDILEDRRKGSDFGWAMKSWDVPPCRNSLKRSPQEIKQAVLNSSKIKEIIIEISKEINCSEQELEQKAKDIVEEMSHNFQFRVIRFFGFVLSKFMKSVYGKILVNKNGVQKIGSISSQYPILYLPTHRSYSDFLLVSYVCFYFNLPLPVIATGLDFLGLKYMTFLLRGAGSFFIRRSFVGDRLYREIFTEYVQTHIEGSEFPIEFFIEGTRSRSAKSLVPKLGMLQAILEMFFSSKVSDITVVPISISYDRTLEETLYAYELLGVPKPKESTKGLIKARKVMSDYFGDVYVRFGEHISLKEYFRNYDRSSHNLHPRSLSVTFKHEQGLCRDLANYVIRMHQCNLLLSPFPIACLVICQPSVARSMGIHFNHLVEYVYWLEELIRRTGATVYVGSENISKALTAQFKIHSNIVHVSDDLHVSLKDGIIHHPEVSPSNIPRLHHLTIQSAIPAMFAYHYGNQALQLLVHVGMVTLACENDGYSVQSQDYAYDRYKLLRKLLQKEFVFEKQMEEKDFVHALQSLKEENILSIDNGGKISLIDSASEKFEFLSSLLLPFLQSYQVVCQYLSQKEGEIPSDSKRLALECQASVENAIAKGSLSDYRSLSLDIINNCIMFLISQGALIMPKAGAPSFLPSHIADISFELDSFLPQQTRDDSSNTRLPLPSAKL